MQNDENARKQPPVLGTAEAAVLSCVNLIAAATDLREETLAYWLDLYYQTRRRYETELEADKAREAELQADAARRQILMDLCCPPPAAPDTAEAGEENGAEQSAPPPREPPGELKGFEPVKPAPRGHQAPKGNGYAADAARFKREARERLIRLREDGRASFAKIREIANGAITDDQVMQILEAKPVPIAVYRLLAAALDKLEE